MIHTILKSKPWHRAFISLLMGVLTFFMVQLSDLEVIFSAISGWIAFSATFLFLNWVIVFKRKVSGIREKAREDDGSAFFVFLVILISSFASMVAVAVLITTQDDGIRSQKFYVPITVLAMILAWTTLHTQYLFHYAHEYYDKDKNGKKNQAEGLSFPDDESPNYLDFAYYSFCIGCTFQVSDVETTSKKLRKLTMVHSLISFFMNTFVVALTINLVAGLSK